MDGLCKIRKVIFKGSNAKVSLDFAYDASGNRVSKTVHHRDGASDATYYLRDASGNVMAVYERTDGSSVVYILKSSVNRLVILDQSGNLGGEFKIFYFVTLCKVKIYALQILH